MPKKKIHSFGSGETDPRLLGRTDFPRYFNSCVAVQNYTIQPTGSALFRAGTQYVANTKNDGASRTISFILSSTISYELEFGELTLRFYRDGAVIGAPYEIATPYTSANLHKLKFKQSFDVMYIVDGINPVMKLSRIADSSWTLIEETFSGGPFLTVNLDDTQTLTPSYPAWSGAASYIPGDIVTTAASAVSPPVADTTLDAGPAVNDGGGLVSIPIAGHNFVAGQSVTLAGTTNYDGTHILQSGTVAATSIQITATYIAEGFAITDTCFPAVTDKGAGLVGIPTTANTFATGARIVVAGTTNYDGTFNAHNSTTATELVIASSFNAEVLDGTETLTETLFHKSLTINSGAATPPGNTTDWTTALTFTGSNLTITSSFALFESTHVGALFKITHPRKDPGIQGFFTAIGVSEWIRVGKNSPWSFTTTGTWGGTIEIQRSYDEGATINFVKIYRSQGLTNARNVAVTGEEESSGALYRIALTFFGSGQCNYDFNVDEFETKGVVKITAFTSSTSVTATVQESLGDVLTTNDWCEGAFSDKQGHPSSIAFFDDRIVYAGTSSKPDTVWLSNSDDFDNFEAGTLDNQSIIKKLTGGKVNEIQWMIYLDNLIIGTTGGIWALIPSNIDESLTQLNSKIVEIKAPGCSLSDPIAVDGAILYINRTKTRVYELIFNNDVQAIVPRNLSRVSAHLSEEYTFEELDVTVEPENVIYVRRSDGTVLSLTYNRSEELIGWARVLTNGVVESISVKPGTTDDELWWIVKRAFGGTDYRMHEFSKPRNFDFQDIRKAWFLDSALNFDGGSTYSITGITNASTAVVTVAGHPFVTGQNVRIEGVLGMTEVNDIFEVVNLSSSTFSLKNKDTGTAINSTSWGTYILSGTVERVVNSVSGLSHLEGRTIDCLIDGATSELVEINAGIAVLADYGNKILCGFAYSGDLEPTPPDFEGGALSGLDQKIGKMIIRFRRTVSATVANEKYSSDLFFLDQDQVLDTGNPLFTGQIEHNLESPWTKSGLFKIQQNKPLPQEVVSIVYHIDAGSL